MRASLLIRPTNPERFILYAFVEDATHKHYTELYQGTLRECLDVAMTLKNAAIEREEPDHD